MNTVRIIFALLITAFAANSYACENTGRITFFNVKGGKGFLIFAYYGADSYTSYVHGETFVQGKSPKNDQGVYFKIDDVAYEHLAVSKSKYSDNQDTLTEEANLIAHYNWEYSYLKNMVAQHQLGLRDVENYGIVESKDGDGKLRKFYLWMANLATGKRYMVSTSSSFGVTVLKAHGVTKGQEEKVKVVIDNFMYKYRNLKNDECK